MCRTHQTPRSPDRRPFAVFLVASYRLLFCASYADASLSVPITVKECAGVGITNYPVSVVVPLSKGAYTNTTTFRLVDAGSDQVPAQFEVLNRWWGSDGSLRHLLIHFQTSLPPFTDSATGTSMYYLRDDGLGNAGTKTALEVTNLTGAIRITTGPLRFTVNTNSFNLAG